MFFAIKGLQDVQGQRIREVKTGDVAVSSEGSYLCLFLGPTPASVLEEPVSENPVVVIGRLVALSEKLKEIKPGDPIRVSAAQETAAIPSPEKNAYASERKLSQAEIDALVKRLLEEKKKAAG